MHQNVRNIGKEKRLTNVDFPWKMKSSACQYNKISRFTHQIFHFVQTKTKKKIAKKNNIKLRQESTNNVSALRTQHVSPIQPSVTTQTAEWAATDMIQLGVHGSLSWVCPGYKVSVSVASSYAVNH